MPRVIGVDIPGNKRTVVALTYLFGVGDTRAAEVCEALKLDPDKRAGELSDEEIGALAAHLENQYALEGSLRRQVAGNINRLREIACYRGLRHRRGLPVRGQRTRTNARGRKGPRKTVAGKKSVKAMK
ncbi:MAG: 30S ribosomal protein S13 [Planctomycetota bacterium]|nr:MAG: 30S ribosomal protein S13 [Planctomycetota bacterium]